MSVIFRREWAMPNKNTFSIPCIRSFIDRHTKGLKRVADPFARNSLAANLTNDINPSTKAAYHMEAGDFLDMLIQAEEPIDAILFDPPYSPRQVAECYRSAGLTATMIDTQTARSKKIWRNKIRNLMRPGGKILTFGWETVGMGKGWSTDEIMLVCHGSDHNDTICMAQTCIEKPGEFAWGEDGMTGIDHVEGFLEVER